MRGLPVSGYLSTQRFTGKHPKTATAFQRAIQKAQQLAAGDGKQVDQVLPAYAHLDAATASALNVPAFPRRSTRRGAQHLADLMLQDGLLKQKIDVRSLVFAVQPQ